MATEVIPHETMYEALRRWPRYKLEVPLRIIAQKSGKTAIVQGRGNELNQGGMAIFAGVELTPGEEVAVEFTPPYSGQPIRVRAVVRNRKGYSYGVEFLTQTIDDHQNVDQIGTVLRGLGSPIR
jgi:hypothetical protein